MFFKLTWLRQLKRILGLVILSFILSSYGPPHYYLKGVVVNKITLDPIDSVLISVKEYSSQYTDSKGGFTIKQIGGGSDFEVLFERKGYDPKFYNFSNRKYDSDSTTIQLQPTKFTNLLFPKINSN